MDDPSTAGVSEGFGLMFYNARFYDPYQDHCTVDCIPHEKGPNPGCGPCLASDYLPLAWLENNDGFLCDRYDCVAHPSTNDEYNKFELFANMGENWVLGNIDPINHGFLDNTMGVNMSDWIDLSWFLGNMGLR